MNKTRNFFFNLPEKMCAWGIFLICFLHVSGTPLAGEPDSSAIIFISDCQEPLFPEKLSGRGYRNAEGRDSLFADIVRMQPRCVILLGDLVGEGSSSKDWEPIRSLLMRLRKDGCQVHAIPGNHEYLMNAQKGIENYSKAFGRQEVGGHCLKRGAVAVVLVNSIFSRLSTEESQKQHIWYLATMDSLDKDSTVTSIIVGTHYPPYTNSSVVGPDKRVRHDFLPRFEQSPKTRFFLSGHSHNLEHFLGNNGKHYLVIGGGGGLTQPLYPEGKREFTDQIPQDKKPLFFSVAVVPSGEQVSIQVRGFDKNFNTVRFFLP